MVHTHTHTHHDYIAACGRAHSRAAACGSHAHTMAPSSSLAALNTVDSSFSDSPYHLDLHRHSGLHIRSRSGAQGVLWMLSHRQRRSLARHRERERGPSGGGGGRCAPDSHKGHIHERHGRLRGDDARGSGLAGAWRALEQHRAWTAAAGVPPRAFRHRLEHLSVPPPRQPTLAQALTMSTQTQEPAAPACGCNLQGLTSGCCNGSNRPSVITCFCSS